MAQNVAYSNGSPEDSWARLFEFEHLYCISVLLRLSILQPFSGASSIFVLPRKWPTLRRSRTWSFSAGGNRGSGMDLMLEPLSGLPDLRGQIGRIRLGIVGQILPIC